MTAPGTNTREPKRPNRGSLVILAIVAIVGLILAMFWLSDDTATPGDMQQGVAPIEGQGTSTDPVSPTTAEPAGTADPAPASPATPDATGTPTTPPTTGATPP